MQLDITDSVLCMTNCNDYKGINDYNLHKVVTATITRTNRPATTDVLEQLTKVTSFQFNFQKKVSANVKLLQAKAAWMESYGVTINNVVQLTLTILANTEMVMQDDYGRKSPWKCRPCTKITSTMPFCCIFCILSVADPYIFREC